MPQSLAMAFRERRNLPESGGCVHNANALDITCQASVFPPEPEPARRVPAVVGRDGRTTHVGIGVQEAKRLDE